MTDPRLILGLDSPDDAGVYQLTDDLAIIQTVDFFTPIVDEPYDFGQIAAANSLSDVYAKGGKPLIAMNMVCFPTKTMDISILKDILKGGVDKILEAGAVLAGGHSIDDKELKYGLSVTGVIHPKKLVTNSGAKAGDKIILTKPLGTGILSTAIKADKLDEETKATLTRSMATLNKTASELMQQIGVHACTDITGFGLIGHTVQLAQNSKVGINVNSDSIPLLPEVERFAQQGLYPGGSRRNRDFYSPAVNFAAEVPEHMRAILFDAQTSGGLLICLSPDKVERLLKQLHSAGIKEAAIIGEVVAEPKGIITVKQG